MNQLLNQEEIDALLNFKENDFHDSNSVDGTDLACVYTNNSGRHGYYEPRLVEIHITATLASESTLDILLSKSKPQPVLSLLDTLLDNYLKNDLCPNRERLVMNKVFSV